MLTISVNTIRIFAMWRILAILAVVLGSLISILVSRGIAESERAAAQAQWEERADGVLTRVQDAMENHVDVLQGLAGKWESVTIPVRPEWQADVKALQAEHPGLIGCELLEPSHKVKFAHPDVMYAYGESLPEPAMVEARDAARDEGPLAVPTKRLEKEGTAYRIFVPIKTPTFHSAMVTGVIAPAEALSGTLTAEEKKTFAMNLEVDGKSLVAATAPSGVDARSSRWSQAGLDFDLSLLALEAPKVAGTQMPATVLGFGLLTSLLLGLALWAMDLFLRRKRAAELANAKLRVEMEQKEKTMEQLKLTEHELQRAQRMEVLGKLTGGIAHEFNNLFTAVRGFLALAQDSLPGEHDVQADLKLASEASAQASDLAGYLLEYSRSHSDEIKPVALNPVLERFDLFLKRALGQEFIVNMELDETAQNGCILTSLFDFQQTLMDLAALAKDRMPAAGVLAIRTRSVMGTETNNVPVADDRLKLSFYLPLRDGEDGRDPEMEACLDTIRQRIDRVGGELELETGADGVCIVSLSFPNVADRVSLPSHMGKKDEGLSRSDGACVLLVEDDTRVLAFATRILECMGCTVMTADSPRDALALGDKLGALDLLVTDIALPGISGTELYDKLKFDNPGLKCLFVSGYEENELRQSWLRGRTDPVLPKPFTLPSLSRAVAELVQNKAA